MLLSAGASSWSKHTLQITTPGYKYQGHGDNSTDAKVNYVAAPLPRYHHSSSMAVSRSGEFFIFGGAVGDQLKNDTWVIKHSGYLPARPDTDPIHVEVTASLVETGGEVPSPRIGHQSALAAGRLIVWGGITSVDGTKGSRGVNDTCIYLLNTSTYNWSKLDIHPAPSARAWHAACVCGTKFMVFGGNSARVGYLNDLWSFDLDSHTPSWEQIEIPPTGESPPGRRAHTMVAGEKSIYLFGGKMSSLFYNDTWCFDMATRAWTKLRSSDYTLPSPRVFHAVALVGNAMYVFGGQDKKQKPLGDTWCFNISERRWYKFSDMTLQPSPRGAHIMVSLDRQLCILGGTSSVGQPEEMSTVHLLDTSLIDYPERENENTLRVAPRTARSLSISSMGPSSANKDEERSRRDADLTVKNPSSKISDAKSPETEPITGNELNTSIDNLQLGTLTARQEEENTSPYRDTALSVTGDIITGAMSATEILRYLVIHGCRDVSEDLEISHVTEYPVSTGGFGDVYCATLRNGHRVGLKCIRMLVDSTLEGRKFAKRAAHELYVWSKCKHPNILELSGVTIFRDQVAMVSPWVENGHVRWFLSQHPQADRCTLCASIADGVDYLHNRGIVHGDLKPDNVLVTKDHTPKLTDFGNAALSEYTLRFSQSTTAQSMSLRWTAPEILNGESQSTKAADIYALGMVIFEVITGTLPFAGAKDPAIMFSIIQGRVPNRPETHIPTGIEQADRLWSLITSCWEYNPHDRPEASVVKDVMGGITPEGLLANRE